MAAPRTMSIGGATYDLFVRTGHEIIHADDKEKMFSLPLGEKIRVKEVIETCGGGAANTSVGLARLGCKAGFCGVVGSDQWGEKLLKNLEKNGVDIRHATVVENEVSSFSIILSASSGERVILYDPGTNEHLHDVTFDRAAVQNADWVYLNHIQETSCVIENDLIDIFTREKHPRLTWNPGGCQIDTGIDAPNNRTLIGLTTLLLLNKEEALKFTKKTSIEEALKLLKEMGAQHVCITDGKNGTLATDGTKMYRCPIIATEEKAVDTTGAGDAFGTGVTWGLLQGYPLHEALKAGSISAANVVSAFGAQAGLLTDIEMRNRLTEARLTVEMLPLT